VVSAVGCGRESSVAIIVNLVFLCWGRAVYRAGVGSRRAFLRSYAYIYLVNVILVAFA